MSRETSVRSVDRESGFTLIELLVSLTLLSGILALLAGAVRVVSKNWEANAQRIERLDMVTRAADILRRDAAGLQRLVVMNGKTPHYLFSGTEANLEFVTLEPPYPSVEGPYFVRYSLAQNGAEVELIRARARYRHGLESFPGATPSNRVRLVQGRYRYRFAYAGRSGGEEKWQRAWPDATRLPDLIRLQIFDVVRDEPLAPPLVVAVRADAEISCLTPGATVCSAKSRGQLKANAATSVNDLKSRYTK